MGYLLLRGKTLFGSMPECYDVAILEIESITLNTPIGLFRDVIIIIVVSYATILYPVSSVFVILAIMLH